MKYHAKYVGGVATSQAANTPWNSIEQNEAIAECADLGGGRQLITNDEWMTIASNIASMGDNWSGGSVGSGSLNRGHSDSSPSYLLEASSDDNDACYGTEESCDGSTWDLQRRTFKLTNGEVLWDFSGNAMTWTSYLDSDSDNRATPSETFSPVEYPLVSDGSNMTKSMLVPTMKDWWNDDWDSTQGIGQYFSQPFGLNAALIRGGPYNDVATGIFSTMIYGDPSDSHPTLGFRCTSPLPPP